MFIQLSNSDKQAIISDEDHHLISDKRWTLSSLGYVICRFKKDGKRVALLMHRVILNAKKGSIIDHRNHDLLDNRRENIRICSHSQNMANRKMSKSNSSGVRGVYFDSSKDRNGRPYRAQVNSNGKRYQKRFDDLELARQWVRAMSIKFHGDFACLDGC